MDPEIKKAAIAAGFTEEQLAPPGLHRVVVTKKDGIFQADYIDRKAAAGFYTGRTLDDVFRELRAKNSGEADLMQLINLIR